MAGIDRKGARRPTGYGAKNKLLQGFPPIEQWDSWTEYDVDAWPRKVSASTCSSRRSASTASRPAG